MLGGLHEHSILLYYSIQFYTILSGHVLLGDQKHVSYRCVLPLLSSLTNVNDDDPDYKAKFKASSVHDFREHVADMASIERATPFDPRFKNWNCLSRSSTKPPPRITENSSGEN